ncbi:VOC family protein [Nocardioides marmotae]|uniref:VOC family protein n=1 Tax=Nocardioides marmotae TaxID=2663857 RepID=A0A6I3JEE3_9ACTN|nr:VOC family protein [Nocardioides marmotae]MCR6032775.1 VOC family protein [Gordonia jinghuaiqii]MBC9735266.1 VOC family protein [Nocardioides marmotae]MTB86366.1 VOC family protein [Nocardioides marmotae]MTB96425.1 VOC family protein [Nocardioides marmotae]QKE02048.1 VOC family protein [Nocardioides marmotae]
MTVRASSITPCLWFDDQLEEAARFYVSLFPHSSVGHLSRYTDAGPGEPGAVMAGDFVLDGIAFRGINGGPQFPFTEAVSFAISCVDQAEVDRYWEALLADGGEESMCGWIKDRFGLSWQVVPTRLYELVSDPDPARAQAAVQAMLGMRRIVVADLEAAADAASSDGAAAPA